MKTSLHWNTVGGHQIAETISASLKEIAKSLQSSIAKAMEDANKLKAESNNISKLTF